MKRDWDLIRKILLDLEARDDAVGNLPPRDYSIEGHTPQVRWDQAKEVTRRTVGGLSYEGLKYVLIPILRGALGG